MYIHSQLLTPWPNFLRQQRRHSRSSLLFIKFLAKMAMSTSFSYASALRGSAGRDGDSQRPPVQVPHLHHVPALSANAVFIDLRVVKPSVTTEERNDFLLEDLRVSVDEVSEIWPEPESQLLRLAFFTADQHKRYLDRLTAGVPWSACRGALVYGWSPGDAVTAVRLTGVPASLPDAVIREHFSQFGRVTRVFRSKDKVFTRAANGIAHISIAVAPGFTLPAFVSLVDADGCTDKRMLVHTDASRRRCSRCGTTGHVAQFCRAGRRAAGADAALWSVIRIPADLLPAAEAAMDTAPARPPPPAAAAASVSRRVVTTPPVAAAASQTAASNTTHVSSTPSLPGGDSAAGAVVAAREVVVPAGGAAPATGAASSAAAAADSGRAALVSSTPSSSTMPGGGSLIGSVAAAREVVAPAGGAAPATGAASPAAADTSAADASAADAPSLPAAADASAADGPSLPAAADASAADGPSQPASYPSYASADSLSPLLLQISALSDGSLPLGQGRQRPEGPGASTAASQPLSPMQSPISTISNSSYQSTQSRDPRLNRSASAHSRGADTEAEDDSALPANTNARPGRKRVLSGGKSGPTKATRKQSKGRSVSPPSQHISQSASP